METPDESLIFTETQNISCDYYRRLVWETVVFNCFLFQPTANNMAQKKAYSKEDLRKLMKQKLESSSKGSTSSETTRIDSPLAAYDSQGNLTCRVCTSRIRENQWTAHLLSKDHKNRLEALKAAAMKGKTSSNQKRKQPFDSNPSATTDQSSGPERNRQEIVNAESSPKKIKNTDEVKGTVISKRELVNKLEEEIDQEQRKEDVMEVEENDKIHDESDDRQQEDEETSNLPPGFFDSHSKRKSVASDSITSSLPKGFFDDPSADAKARNVSFVDPLDEEYAEFQKIMSSETNRSEVTLQEDLEADLHERTIQEIDEQIEKWKRIQELEIQLEERMKQGFVKKKNTQQETQEEEEEDDTDDDNLSCLLDWRKKGGFK